MRAKGCYFAECDRRHAGYGLCAAHRHQERTRGVLSPVRAKLSNKGVICLVESCETPAEVSHMCIRHYGQHIDGRTPGELRAENKGKSCSLDYCERPARAKELCKSHRAQQRRGHSFTPIGEARKSTRRAAFKQIYM